MKRSGNSPAILLTLFLSVLVGGLILPSPSAQDQDNQRIERLVERIESAADSVFTNRGVTLEREARQRLEEFIRGGANRLVNDRASRTRENQVIEKFSSRLDEAVGKFTRQGDLITADLFESIKKYFCPSYPFC